MKISVSHISRKTGNAAVAIVLALAAIAGAATVTVNPATEYQTIQGFGAATEGYSCPYLCGEGRFPGNNQGDQYVLEIAKLGLTMMRMHGGPDDWENGNPKNNYTWMKNIQAAVKAAGDDDTVRYIFSTWTPPGSMKNGAENAPGTLKAASQDAFCDYLANYYKKVQDSSGCRIYAAHFGNEVSFANPFYACTYSPGEYVTVMNKFVPKIKALSPWIKFMGADELEETTKFSVANAIAANATAKGYMSKGVYSIHYYVGSAPTSSSTSGDAPLWKDCWSEAQKLGTPSMIMNETSGYCDTWDGNAGCQTACCGNFDKSAFWYAYGMLAGLIWGHIEGWTQYGAWELVEWANRGAVMKQFARYIRPGSIAIDTRCDNTNIMALAFNNKRKAKLSIVLLNLATSVQTTAISVFGGPATYDGYQSSATQKCASIGSLSATNVSLPARSITTLVGDFGTKSSVQKPAGRRAGAAMHAGNALLYRLDGSLASSRAALVTHAREGTAAMYVRCRGEGGAMLQVAR